MAHVKIKTAAEPARAAARRRRRCRRLLLLTVVVVTASAVHRHRRSICSILQLVAATAAGTRSTTYSPLVPRYHHLVPRSTTPSQRPGSGWTNVSLCLSLCVCVCVCVREAVSLHYCILGLSPHP